MLTNKDIKAHEIQLSASAILSEHERRQEKPAKKHFSWKIFFAVASPLVTAAVIVPLVLLSVHPTANKPQIQDLFALGEGERISSAVVSSVYLLPSSASSSVAPRFKNGVCLALSQNDFQQVVEVYDQADTLLEKRFSSSGENYVKAENAAYKGVYGEYAYQIAISGEEALIYHFNYSKDESEVSFTGEVTRAGATYRIDGQNEVKGDESEYTYTAKLDEKNYLTIEEEKEVDEYAYHYTLVQNGVEKYALTYEKEEEINLTFVSGSSTYSYEVNSGVMPWSIAYQSALGEGTMTLARNNGQKTYTDVDSGLQIIK